MLATPLGTLAGVAGSFPCFNCSTWLTTRENFPTSSAETKAAPPRTPATSNAVKKPGHPFFMKGLLPYPPRNGNNPLINQKIAVLGQPP